MTPGSSGREIEDDVLKTAQRIGEVSKKKSPPHLIALAKILRFLEQICRAKVHLVGAKVQLQGEKILRGIHAKRGLQNLLIQGCQLTFEGSFPCL